MIKILLTFFQEPLVHFLILGAILYTFYETREVVKPQVSQERVVNIVKELNETKEETAFRVYKEILLLEAYNLELEKQDSFISQRLVSQMEFILTAKEKFEEPSEEKLYEFYKKHIQDYSEVEALSFHYLRFSSFDDAELLKYQTLLNAIHIKKIKNSHSLENLDLKTIQDRFGKYFTKKILEQSLEKWSSAIHAKDAVYLIYIDKKSVLSVLSFDSVEGRVYKDYKEVFLNEIKRTSYDSLRKRYRVEIK